MHDYLFLKHARLVYNVGKLKIFIELPIPVTVSLEYIEKGNFLQKFSQKYAWMFPL
jgi:hypothetical protein